jgi:hypothetical protein
VGVRADAGIAYAVGLATVRRAAADARLDAGDALPVARDGVRVAAADAAGETTACGSA